MHSRKELYQQIKERVRFLKDTVDICQNCMDPQHVSIIDLVQINNAINNIIQRFMDKNER
jgi:DNA modification methylase